MTLTPQQVLTQLQQQQYAPVYFLQGEEPYYIDQITRYIEANVLSAAEKGFNLTIAYGKDVSMGQVLGQARRFPMGARHQVVIVREAQGLADLQREAGCKLLMAYLQAPQPATLLVFAHKHKKLDARTAVSKALAQHAVVVNTKPLLDHQVPAWMHAYVQEKGMTINEKATWMLQEFVGNDLERLAKELDKLKINQAAGTAIDEHLVQTYVGINKQYNAFELQKALAQKDHQKATKIICYFEANPKASPAIMLVALLFNFFSKLLLVHQAPSKAEEALAPLLQVSPYFVGEYVRAAQHYPLPQVLDNIHHLHVADLRLKGINYPATPEGQLLKELIFKLMHRSE